MHPALRVWHCAGARSPRAAVTAPGGAAATAAAAAGAADEGGAEEGFGGGFGVRRPLRFLAHKLGLDDRQVTEMARILNELKTERAQAEVDRRRTVAALADALAGDAFDAAKAGEAGALRVAERGTAARRRRQGAAADPRRAELRAARPAGVPDPHGDADDLGGVFTAENTEKGQERFLLSAFSAVNHRPAPSVVALLDIDAIAHQPQVQLLQTFLPPTLEFPSSTGDSGPSRARPPRSSRGCPGKPLRCAASGPPPFASRSWRPRNGPPLRGPPRRAIPAATCRPSLNWRGSSTSNRRHLLLISRLALDGEGDVYGRRTLPGRPLGPDVLRIGEPGPKSDPGGTPAPFFRYRDPGRRL